MSFSFPSAFFVTATDTEVGKTFISGMLAVGLGAGYWKPIRTGMPRDTDWVREYTGLDRSHLFDEAYVFAPNISPHEAAQMEGVEIELSKIRMPDFAPLPHLIVEGAGGLLVPINDNQTILDMILHLDLPVLVIARSTLGTINHTCLTIDKLRRHSVPILGVIMNGPRHASNRQAIEHYAQVPVLAEVEPMAVLTPTTIKAAFHKYFGSKDGSNNKSDNFSGLASVHAS
jgi:dethiobiotin synthetase